MTRLDKQKWLYGVYAFIVTMLTASLGWLVLWRNLETDRAWFLLALLGIWVLAPLATSISEVSAFGVTAKLRAEVQKAEAVALALKNLAEVVGGEMIRNLAASAYFFDPNSTSDRLAARDRVRTVFRELGVSDSEIKRIEAPANVYFAFMLQDAVRKSAFPKLTPQNSGEFMKEFNAARDFEGRRVATAADLRAILEKYDAIDGTTEGWLRDYSYFLDTSEVRRPIELNSILNQPKG